MFYAEIANELKQLAGEATRQYLESGEASDSEKLLVALAPYLVGFVGVHVDFPQGDFHRGLDERKWIFSDVTDLGYMFEGEDTDGEQDRALFIPAGQMHALRFMFRDPVGVSSWLPQTPPVARGKSGKGSTVRRSGSDVLEAEDGGPTGREDVIRPGMYRDGEEM